MPSGLHASQGQEGFIINPQSATSSPLLDLYISWVTCSLSIPHFNKWDILDGGVLVLFILATTYTIAILSLRLITLPNNENVYLFCLSLNQSLLFHWSLPVVKTSMATASSLLTPTLLSIHCRVSGEIFSSTSNCGIFSNNNYLLKLSPDFSWFFFWTVQLVSTVLFGSKLLPIKVAHNNWTLPFFCKDVYKAFISSV